MKTTNVGLVAMMTLASFALFAATPVAADCENYGNLVIVGSNYECTVNHNVCDGEAGPAGSGAGAGAGAGAGGSSGAEAGAKAGTSTNCEQCSGSCSGTGNGTEPGGFDGVRLIDAFCHPNSVSLIVNPVPRIEFCALGSTFA